MDVHRPDLSVAQLAARQWGVVSLADLRRCGLSATAISHRVRKGWLHPIHMGVYAVGHPSVPLKGRFLAAVMAGGPTVALSHFAAAAYFDYVDWDGRRPEITIPGTSPRAHPGILVHRSRRLGPEDMVVHRGIRVTTRERTLVDLAAVTGPRQLRQAVKRALTSKPRVTVGRLGAELVRLGPRRGRRNLARILAAGPAPTRSELEDVVLELIVRGGFEPPNVNVPLEFDGRVVIPDFRWPDRKLIVEADGAAWHDNKVAREDDAMRQALLEAHGERVIRVTWQQAVFDSRQTIARFLRAGAPILRTASD